MLTNEEMNRVKNIIIQNKDDPEFMAKLQAAIAKREAELEAEKATKSENMITFNNPEFGNVRVIDKDGEPWFVGKEVAEMLGYSNPKNATPNHVDEEDRLSTQIEYAGQMRNVTLINESGLYSLVLSSKLPNAKKFKRWVTSEVLPSIRKHGAYMTPETLEKAMLNPDYLLKLTMQLKSEHDKRLELEVENSQIKVENAIMLPKAQYFDQLCERNTLTGMRETAKMLGVTQKRFINFLLEKKYLYRDKHGHLMPYQNRCTEGLFELKESFNTGNKWSGTQTLITPKGREAFRLLMIG